MVTLVKMILKAMGWQKLLILVWNLVKVPAMEAAQKTDTKFDDKLIETVDEIVKFASTVQTGGVYGIQK